MTKYRRTSPLRIVAAVLTGLAGFLAFNIVDGVFGLVDALVSLAACIAVTIFVFRRAPTVEAPDA
jgi:uncharacterized membrane protein YuzA (DUF378 family)